MLYEKTPRPPEPGSPMEILFILVWKMRQTIEFQKSRAIVQSLLAQKDAESESIKKVYENLKEAYFPFDKNAKAAEAKKWREVLMREIAMGPLMITPKVDLTPKQIRSRLAKGQRQMAERLSQERSGELVRMDPFEKASRRPRGAL